MGFNVTSNEMVIFKSNTIVKSRFDFTATKAIKAGDKIVYNYNLNGH